MPTQLHPSQHLEGLRSAMVAFVRYADRAGLSAPVPTCPEWSVRDLVAHQGMVHRWAARLLRGEWTRDADADHFEAEGRAAEDPLEWLREGAIELVETIARAADDVRAPVFLDDAPAPRAFWARRQCHETTIHAVDALSAVFGRHPDPAETWIGAELASDGIDEMLTGFVTRPRSRLRCAEDAVLVVAPDDVPAWWLLRLGPRPAVAERGSGPRPDLPPADWELTGTAVELYLALWNRTVRPELGAAWGARTAITWG
ncbi:maleylpyruvate isomerase family mycothiol-dependent enzyme [Nocardioides sp. YIM 152315]|uniref:maleylpyruvate isomerase family mycothiol-dependent enzyme n=1 Tax=Nocardioides sp. YIM 152315 TaxID=3031760 RepID=UPI0023D97AB0|nr:maleylpyruvate isomerase family mycothiol-dependent enzyme [Nocardioides sp. YIM 152315]MDF1604558.1 maleylpyruvate isomerase family mycothiol-dependent enzyme [Nocardioides sp. YIM 152315]